MCDLCVVAVVVLMFALCLCVIVCCVDCLCFEFALCLLSVFALCLFVAFAVFVLMCLLVLKPCVSYSTFSPLCSTIVFVIAFARSSS